VNVSVGSGVALGVVVGVGVDVAVGDFVGVCEGFGGFVAAPIGVLVGV
jgi:hypothetical protein